eukprot:g4259.t1
MNELLMIISRGDSTVSSSTADALRVEVSRCCSTANRSGAGRERGVADPAVAVVPVADAADELGQACRGRSEDGAGRAVAEGLQRRSISIATSAIPASDGVGSDCRRAVDLRDRCGRERIRTGAVGAGTVALSRRRCGRPVRGSGSPGQHRHHVGRWLAVGPVWFHPTADDHYLSRMCND